MHGNKGTHPILTYLTTGTGARVDPHGLWPSLLSWRRYPPLACSAPGYPLRSAAAGAFFPRSCPATDRFIPLLPIANCDGHGCDLCLLHGGSPRRPAFLE
jgi:hypothetical protein